MPARDTARHARRADRRTPAPDPADRRGRLLPLHRATRSSQLPPTLLPAAFPRRTARISRQPVLGTARCPHRPRRRTTAEDPRHHKVQGMRLRLPARPHVRPPTPLLLSPMPSPSIPQTQDHRALPDLPTTHEDPVRPTPPALLFRLSPSGLHRASTSPQRHHQAEQTHRLRCLRGPLTANRPDLRARHLLGEKQQTGLSLELAYRTARASPAFKDMRVLRNPDRSEIPIRPPPPLVQPPMPLTRIPRLRPGRLLQTTDLQALREALRRPRSTLVLHEVLPAGPWLARKAEAAQIAKPSTYVVARTATARGPWDNASAGPAALIAGRRYRERSSPRC